jgi:hypothetical protein
MRGYEGLYRGGKHLINMNYLFQNGAGRNGLSQNEHLASAPYQTNQEIVT